MTRWIVIPIKAPDRCKTRLRGALTDARRQALTASMLRHVVDAASGIDDVAVLLLGPSRHGLPDSLPVLADPRHGLNGALASATRTAAAAGISRVAFVSADLPFVTRADLASLLAVAPAEAAIAPDRWGRGTNALCLPLPAGSGFRFAYGAGSFFRHRAEAARLGLRALPINAPGLAFDIDTPEDLETLGQPRAP